MHMLSSRCGPQGLAGPGAVWGTSATWLGRRRRAAATLLNPMYQMPPITLQGESAARHALSFMGLAVASRCVCNDAILCVVPFRY
mmetsp:Transcript_130465/g.260329  ORF Transcript_130465/g.260329 Transcript_130465/m.260329 type:complete len:85 (+) Transcript_130465:559-813(+)